MASSSSAIDWEILKPKILRLLAAGKTRRDVLQEISKDGSRITLVSHACPLSMYLTDNDDRKSQCEYQLKCWGWRTNLSEKGWKYTKHKVQKRARENKTSAVFFNGALIPHDKVVKETRRHDRPTMLPGPGGKFDPQPV